MSERMEIHLQGIGRLPAIPAGELKVGDILSWNFSLDCSEVTRIVGETKTMIDIEETYRAGHSHAGETFPRRLKKARGVAAKRARENKPL